MALIFEEEFIMKFEDFKKKYFGKDLDFVIEGLKKEDLWKKDVDIVEISSDLDNIIQNIIDIDKDSPTEYVLKRKYLIYRYIFEKFLKLDSVPREMELADYNIVVEEAIYQLYPEARFVKDMVNVGLEELRNIVLEELYKTFNENAPSSEEIEKIAVQMRDMFKDESPEKLETIREILEFNDPALKEIKDGIYNNPKINKLEKDLKNNK
jgi:hypothetical protein